MDTYEFNKLNIGYTILFQGEEYWVQKISRFLHLIGIYMNDDDDWHDRVTWLPRSDCSMI